MRKSCLQKTRLLSRSFLVNRLTSYKYQGGFHQSWFNISSDICNVKSVTYDEDIVSQISSLKTKGYTIIRYCDVGQTLGSHHKYGLLKEEILTLFASKKESWLYNIWRYFNHVRAPEKRHTIPLPNSALLMNVLTSVMTRVKPVLLSQLSLNSPLVDLSTILSLPGNKLSAYGTCIVCNSSRIKFQIFLNIISHCIAGSTRQKTHTDIPYSDNELILSGLVALSRVDVLNGPTYLYAGSHTKSFHNTHVTSNYSTGDRDLFTSYHYASDGTAADNVNGENNKVLSQSHAETLSDIAAVSLTAASAPLACVLNAGLFHRVNIFVLIKPSIKNLLSLSLTECRRYIAI
jgi:hypothetical protein